ncbi:hypothetical protein L345_14476, partial [Ophiophagus hannah]
MRGKEGRKGEEGEGEGEGRGRGRKEGRKEGKKERRGGGRRRGRGEGGGGGREGPQVGRRQPSATRHTAAPNGEGAGAANCAKAALTDEAVIRPTSGGREACLAVELPPSLTRQLTNCSPCLLSCVALICSNLRRRRLLRLLLLLLYVFVFPPACSLLLFLPDTRMDVHPPRTLLFKGFRLIGDGKACQETSPFS